MALPPVDFAAIADIAHEALRFYGTTATFTHQKTGISHPIKTVIYRDTSATAMIQDIQTSPALALFDPKDFESIALPEKYDSLKIGHLSYSAIWTLQSDPHPIYAGDELPILIAELRRN